MIYFDNAATYLNDKTNVLKVFNDSVINFPFNPNSNNYHSYKLKLEIDNIREEILKLLKLNNEYEVIFNSSATEGINHFIKGYCSINRNRGNKVLYFCNEHSSVLNTIEYLKENNFNCIKILCNKEGEINYKEIENNIDDKTILVIVMSVNNEVGSVNNLDKVSEITKKYPKCNFFSDITQSFGKIDLNYKNIDAFAFSSHKFGGLIGSGVLVKKKKIRLQKLLDGGDQENNNRGGTVSAPLIFSTYEAIKISLSNLNANYKYVLKLYNHLKNRIEKEINDIEINSYSGFPYIFNFSFLNKKSSVIIQALDRENIVVSSLSACDSKVSKISNTLMNMKNNNIIASNSIRISFSTINTIEEIDIFIEKLKKIISEIK